MNLNPDLVRARLEVMAETFPEVAKAVVSAVEAVGFSPVATWAAPSRDGYRSGGYADALDAISRKKVDNAIFNLEDNSSIAMYPGSESSDASHTADITLVFSGIADRKLATALAPLAAVSKQLAAEGLLRNASLCTYGGGLECVPYVPLIEEVSHIAFVSGMQVSEAYDDENGFWKAGWDSSNEYGEYTLLTRGLAAANTTEYLAQVLPEQWRMARAAKPGITEYFLPTVLPEEQKIYAAGAKTLEIVGHLAGENLVELTCSLSPGEHINGWEVYDLLALMESGELPDGRVVDKVRVVFIEKETALQEKRVLLDIGVEVHAYNDDGELIQITD